MKSLLDKIVDRIKEIAIGVGALILPFSISAQTHYFNPDFAGHGVSVTQDGGQGSSFIWYLYNRAGEPRWLITTENCATYPCETKLAEASGAWMGGDFELAEVGHVKIDFKNDRLFWEYDLSAWPDSGDCGRMIWLYETKCIGKFTMEAID